MSFNVVNKCDYVPLLGYNFKFKDVQMFQVDNIKLIFRQQYIKQHLDCRLIIITYTIQLHPGVFYTPTLNTLQHNKQLFKTVENL